MDQDARTAGSELGAREAQPAETGETRSPEEIRADIAQTREEVGDTVEALAAKTDVKSRAQEKVEEIKANVRAKAPGSSSGEGGGGSGGGGAQQGAQQIVATVRKNPAPFALASAALFGFLVSRLTDRRP